MNSEKDFKSEQEETQLITNNKKNGERTAINIFPKKHKKGNQVVQQNAQKKSNEFHATVNLFKGLVGIGILSLPIGFSKSGWLAGLIILPICGIAMLYLSQQMMAVADKAGSKAKNITEFCSEKLGKNSITFVNICLFGIQLGVCISYVIFFTTYFKKSFCHTLGETNYACESRIPSLLVALTILLPSIFIRHMDNLKKWSMSANIFILFSLFIISVYCGLRISNEGQPPIQKFNSSTIGDSVGIFIFTFEGVGLYFDVRHSMQEPKRFFAVLNYVIYFALILYTSFGFLGYITFGDQIKDIILFNFDLKNPVLFVVQILYCISLILSYPIQIFPCVNLIEHKILKKFCEKEFNELCQQRERRLSEVNQYLQSETDDKAVPNVHFKRNFSSSLSRRQMLSGGEQTDEENKLEEQRYQEKHLLYSTFLEEDDILENQDDNQINELILNEEDEGTYLMYSYLVRIGFLIFVFAMALSIDRISIFINFIGSICGTALCYFIPILIIHKHADIPLWKSIINWTIFFVSSVCGLFGAYSSIRMFAKDFGQDI